MLNKQEAISALEEIIRCIKMDSMQLIDWQINNGYREIKSKEGSIIKLQTHETWLTIHFDIIKEDK